MSDLKKSQRVLKGLEYFGNFLEKKVNLGDIYTEDDGLHLKLGNLSDYINNFSWVGKFEEGEKSNLTYTRESCVDFKLGIQGNVQLAEAEVSLKFTTNRSAFVSLKDVVIKEALLGKIHDDLIKVWKEKGFNKPGKRMNTIFISEIIYAQSGTLIYSEAKNNNVVLKAKNNQPITSIDLLASGDFSFVTNSKSTLEIISTNPIYPLYRALRLDSKNNFEVFK